MKLRVSNIIGASSVMYKIFPFFIKWKSILMSLIL